MSLVGVIARFKTGTYEVRRTATGTSTAGKYTPGAVAVLGSFDMCIQPVTGRELKPLAEARQTSEIRVAYSATELRTTPDPDTVTINGELWDVFKVEPWEHWGAGHWRAYLSRRSTT